jgi:hypothetical protein
MSVGPMVGRDTVSGILPSCHDTVDGVSMGCLFTRHFVLSAPHVLDGCLATCCFRMDMGGCVCKVSQYQNGDHNTHAVEQPSFHWKLDGLVICNCLNCNEPAFTSSESYLSVITVIKMIEHYFKSA